MTVEEVGPWLQLVSVIGAVVYGVSRMQTAIQRGEDARQHQEDILRELKRTVELMEQRLDGHDRFLAQVASPGDLRSFFDQLADVQRQIRVVEEQIRNSRGGSA